MKATFLFLAGIALLSVAHAQNPFANTAWQGHATIPERTEILFHFTSDSIYMYMLPQKVIVETMVYKANDSTFTWRKTSGGSPCDTTAIGTNRFVIKDNEMSIEVISDDCPARELSLIAEPFTKVDVPVK